MASAPAASATRVNETVDETLTPADYHEDMRRLSDRRVTTVFALVLASGLCGGFLFVRTLETGTSQYQFLVWNLMLAWLPFLAALALYDGHTRGRGPVGQLALALGWLLFLPNAPYIVTDFLHVGVITGAPLWFDSLLVASFAGMGMLLGLGSLLLVQSVVARSAGAVWGWLMLAPTLLLCSVGIVLGRVYRFNSWDVLSRPGDLVRVIGDRLADPAGSMFGVALLGGLTCSLVVAYLVMYAIAGLVRDGESPPR
jgi:uncharacterized membrane protein